MKIDSLGSSSCTMVSADAATRPMLLHRSRLRKPPTRAQLRNVNRFALRYYAQA